MGRLKLNAPAAAWGLMVTTPLTLPVKAIDPKTAPDEPIVSAPLEMFR